MQRIMKIIHKLLHVVKVLNDSYEDVYLYWPTVISVRSENIRSFVFEGGYEDHLEIRGNSHPLWFKDGRP